MPLYNMNDPTKLSRIFTALSVDTRIRIVLLLRERCLCVNALAARLGVTPAAVSQHLRVLRDAGLLIAERRGCYVHYRLDGRTLQRWGRMANGLLSPSVRPTKQGVRVGRLRPASHRRRQRNV